MRRVGRGAAVAALVGIALGFTSSITQKRPGVAVLEVWALGRGIVWQGPIAALEPFDVSFTHSVEHTRWVHHYRAEPGVIAQRGSTFSAFGAGVPSVSADGSPLLRLEDGYLALAPMRLPVLRMLNWRAAELTLSYRGQELPLGRLIDDFDALEIRVR